MGSNFSFLSGVFVENKFLEKNGLVAIPFFNFLVMVVDAGCFLERRRRST